MGTYRNLSLGQKIVTPAKTVTPATATIMTGLGGYTHPMFNDEEYAKAMPFGGMVIPGEMTLFLMGGLAEQSGIFDETVIGLVGLDKIRFKTPACAGDTLRLEMQVAAKRETSKGDKGLVTFGWVCRNQRQETVLEAEATFLLTL